MSELYDLHCHSTASDGALTPAVLIERAKQQGVTTLALTDHDTTSGLAEAQTAANAAGIRFVPGIELSSQWKNKCLHIVGLGIDPSYAPLADATQALRATRLERAEEISRKLEKKRIPGAFEAVKQMAGDSMVTRTHFADFLLSNGYVFTQQEAFDRYLAKGKPAYVSADWADMRTAVEWIVESGGVAVLAHPLRYQLTASWLRRLLDAFKEAGGQGIEIVTGRYNAEEIKRMRDDALRFGLAGSAGSDFHTPATPYVELGRLAPLPDGIRPVWDLLH